MAAVALASAAAALSVSEPQHQNRAIDDLGYSLLSDTAFDCLNSDNAFACEPNHIRFF
jgi:hypothetical protein